jgi:hypothetical protein
VGHFLPQIVRKKVLNAVMRPFADPAGSVNEDIWLLRHSPLMPADIPIHGLVRAVLWHAVHVRVRQLCLYSLYVGASYHALHNC